MGMENEIFKFCFNHNERIGSTIYWSYHVRKVQHKGRAFGLGYSIRAYCVYIGLSNVSLIKANQGG